MKEVVQSLKNNLDYENNYYFYHETGYGNGQSICDEGFFINGTNILGVQNLLLTTTIPLTIEMIDNEDEFSMFLKSEIQNSRIRDVSEIVILGIPKEDIDFALQPLIKKEKEKEYELNANYIVDSRYVLGYIDLRNEEINFNENYFDYIDDFTY